MEDVEAVVNTGARASAVGRHQARKLGIWKRTRKVKVRQGDGSFLGGNFVVNASFKVMDLSSVLGKFAMDPEVLDIADKNVILQLSWLPENGFSVDTQDRCLRNVNSGQGISFSLQ